MVYRIDNVVDGNFYIGVCSGGLAKRKREHLCCARRATQKGQSHLYNAIRKHGVGHFQFGVVADGMTYTEAMAMEVRLISELSPAYNITKGGEGVLGTKITEDGRRRLSEFVSSRPGYWRGKKRPDLAAGARERLLKNPLRYWAGKKRDPETNRKISETKKRKLLESA